MAQQTTSSVEAALDLAGQEFAVFPVHYIKPDGSCSCGTDCGRDAGKHPMTADGFKSASTDPAAVQRMFRGQRSSANIGVATGPASGIWVLDVEAAGLPILDELQQRHGTLPTTVSSFTGGGGRHLAFKWNGREIRNKTKISGLPIDCRGIGGYVVVPPSNHKSGLRYTWEHAPGTTPIVEAPSWLVEFVTNKTSSKPAGSSPVAPSAVEDLSTAPGAGEGQRHSEALRLIGRAIGRGTDPVEVERQALAWAASCSPPMDEAEVKRIVSDLAARDATKPAADRSRIPPGGTPAAVSFADQVETAILDQPIREPAPWPELDDAAFYGLAGEIVRMIEPETEADPVAILLQLIVSFGNMIGRSPYFAVEGTSHHANLFAVLVGNTARGRKGTSEGRVRQVLRSVDEPWVLRNISTGLVSGEGLVWNIRDPIIKTELVKDKGQVVGTQEVVADPGVEDKRLLVVEPEFASALKAAGRERNTLSPTIRSAWDSGILRTLAKNSPAVATDAHVSIVGHITHEELRRTLAEVEFFSGFANRILWVVVKRSKLLPDGGRDLDLTILAQRLALAAEQARSVERMQRDQAAAALWRQVYAELADDQAGGLLGAVTSRAEAQVLRLSMVYALLDGDGMIREQHLRAALAVWRYCRSSAAMIFGDLGADPVEDQVLAAIRQAPGLGRRELHRALGNHVKAAVLVRTLARLRDAGRVRVEKTETGGRPAERWFTCEQSEQSEQRQAETPQPGLSSHSSLSSQHNTDNSTGTGTPAAEPEPAVCDHREPETWVHRDGKAYCRVCDRFMGRVRT